MQARSDSSDASRTSTPPTRTAPSVTSYTRGTSIAVVDLPAPDGPTSATIWPGSMVNDTPRSTGSVTVRSRVATSSSDASETSAADGYRKVTSRNSTLAEPGGTSTGFSGSEMAGGRSSTSNTRSKLTSADMMFTRALERPAIGPYSRVSSSASVTTVPAEMEPLTASQPPSP